MGERLLFIAPRAGGPPLPAQARWSTRVALGTRIRHARVAAGLTEEALAADLTTVAYLSRIEANERRPSPSLLAELTQRLGIPLDRLTGGESPAVEGLRFELAHADLLLATRRFDDAARVGGDLAEIATRIGSPDVADSARVVRAMALAAIGQRRKALRIVRPLAAGPTALPALVAGARFHLLLGDLGGVVTIGQRVEERLAAEDRLSHTESADLAVSLCRAHEGLGHPDEAHRIAQQALQDLPPHPEDLTTRTAAASLAVSYRNFDQAVRHIESAVATLHSARLRGDLDHLRRF